MTPKIYVNVSFILISLIAPITIVIKAQAQDTTPLRLVQTIPLPNVEGRIDHLAVDIKGQRLFIAALGNNNLEVLDLRAAKLIHRITGLHEPQGVFYVPEVKKVFVANGGNGALEIFDSDSFKLIDSVKFSDDADNIRYDAIAKYIYVGYGDGALGIIDATSGKHIGDIELKGHPESFQIENSGARIFVNIPMVNHIAVVDRKKRIVVTTWPLTGARENFPMALDEINHRLFVGLRKPAKLVVFDTESGKAVISMSGAGDADDIFYDAAHKRIYMSCGEGFINVFQQGGADHYKIIANIPTASGARTSLFVPELNRFYLAVPHHGSQRAEVRIYEVLQ
ncbi:MAG: YncE family protein [Ignavibacteriales bacterium]